MKIESDKITIKIGCENEDFKFNKHTIICSYKNLSVKFKIDDLINYDLKVRLIIYKAKKRFKTALAIYPLGGYIKYSLH